MDIPMMISGITKENSMRKLAPTGAGPRQRDMPIAKATPNGTAMNMVMNDKRRLWISAARSSGLMNSAPDGSYRGCPHHHWVENPCQTEFDRPELNEITTAMSTGSSDHARYAHVAVARMCGRRQGLRHHPRSALVLLEGAGGTGPAFWRSTPARSPTVSLLGFSLPSQSPACSTPPEPSATRQATGPAPPPPGLPHPPPPPHRPPPPPSF